MAVTDVTRIGRIVGGAERDAKSGATFETIDEKGLQALDSYLQTKNVCVKFA